MRNRLIILGVVIAAATSTTTTSCKKSLFNRPTACDTVFCTQHLASVGIKVVTNEPSAKIEMQVRKSPTGKWQPCKKHSNLIFTVATDGDNINFLQEKLYKIRVTKNGAVQATHNIIIGKDCCHVFLKSGPTVITL